MLLQDVSLKVVKLAHMHVKGQGLKSAWSPFVFGNSALRCTGKSTDASAGHPATRAMNVPITSSATYGTVLLIFRRDGEYSSLSLRKMWLVMVEGIVECHLVPSTGI